jgi:hypothetical protein
MSKQRNVLKLSPDDQEAWLDQHLPNRVGAVWVDLPDMKGGWEWKGQRPLGPGHFAQNADRNQVWCICRAVENGQKAAMRFLIEFVGIALKEDKNYKEEGIPGRPTKYDDGTDVSIQCFATNGNDLQITLNTTDKSSKAWILARVWNGCTQSCVHPTFKTDHYRAEPADLAEAFTIITEHLQAKLYGPRGGKSLSQIVREQH